MAGRHVLLGGVVSLPREEGGWRGTPGRARGYPAVGGCHIIAGAHCVAEDAAAAAHIQPDALEAEAVATELALAAQKLTAVEGLGGDPAVRDVPDLYLRARRGHGRGGRGVQPLIVLVDADGVAAVVAVDEPARRRAGEEAANSS